jgi:hypothetical protein
MEFLALWSAQTLLESKELCAALMRRLKAQLEVVFMVKQIAGIDGFFQRNHPQFRFVKYASRKTTL